MVHTITTPTGDQSWTTLCSSGTENTCQLYYEEMGTSVDGVSQYDATNTTYNGIVRVGHTIRFLFDAGHDVIKMDDASCDNAGEFLSGSHDGEYDYTVTADDAAAGYIYFSCSTSNYGHCLRGQRVTVEVSDACAGEGCANVCSVGGRARAARAPGRDALEEPVSSLSCFDVLSHARVSSSLTAAAEPVVPCYGVRSHASVASSLTAAARAARRPRARAFTWSRRPRDIETPCRCGSRSPRCSRSRRR